jgi:hypothetical protein
MENSSSLLFLSSSRSFYIIAFSTFISAVLHLLFLRPHILLYSFPPFCLSSPLRTKYSSHRTSPRPASQLTIPRSLLIPYSSLIPFTPAPPPLHFPHIPSASLLLFCFLPLSILFSFSPSFSCSIRLSSPLPPPCFSSTSWPLQLCV